MLAHIDSGAGFSETELNLAIDDDYIRPDQTEWFLREHELAGQDVPAIAYYHIAQNENQKAWLAVTEEGEDLKNKFFKLEGFADNGKERFASDFIDRAKEHNLKAAFMGHAHNVDWTVEYEGVVIGLGVKTGGELYYAHIDTASDEKNMQAGLASVGITENFDLMGASLVTLTGSDGSFDLEYLYFNERENGDFSAWVKRGRFLRCTVRSLWLHIGLYGFCGFFYSIFILDFSVGYQPYIAAAMLISLGAFLSVAVWELYYNNLTEEKRRTAALPRGLISLPLSAGVMIFYFLALKGNLDGPSNVGFGIIPIAYSSGMNISTVLVVPVPLIVSLTAFVKGIYRRAKSPD